MKGSRLTASTFHPDYVYVCLGFVCACQTIAFYCFPLIYKLNPMGNNKINNILFYIYVYYLIY